MSAPRLGAGLEQEIGHLLSLAPCGPTSPFKVAAFRLQIGSKRTCRPFRPRRLSDQSYRLVALGIPARNPEYRRFSPRLFCAWSRQLQTELRNKLLRRRQPTLSIRPAAFAAPICHRKFFASAVNNQLRRATFFARTTAVVSCALRNQGRQSNAVRRESLTSLALSHSVRSLGLQCRDAEGQANPAAVNSGVLAGQACARIRPPLLRCPSATRWKSHLYW